MIVALGECLIEITERAGVLRAGYGGDTLNTLTYLARLLPQRRESLYYVTGLGEDPFSSQMIRAWQKEGIRTELVRKLKNHLPGLYYIRTDAAGERRFFYWRERSAARGVLTVAYLEKLIPLLAGCEIFYFSGISLGILRDAGRERLLQLVEGLKAAGARIVFDSNYRAPLWQSAAAARTCMQRVYPHVDVALVSFGDEQQLFSDATPEQTCRRLCETGVAEVVVKNGSESCMVGIGGHIEAYPLLIKVKPVDTTAAGDAFNAAYLAARLQRETTRAAVTAANRLASQVVQFPGALMPIEKTPLLQDLL
ncbi:MAG: sugar kinase [Gammaproteobacteria bacterium]|nr:sugar kinase [Gammaproteobacteria bacterium]